MSPNGSSSEIWLCLQGRLELFGFFSFAFTVYKTCRGLIFLMYVVLDRAFCFCLFETVTLTNLIRLPYLQETLLCCVRETLKRLLILLLSFNFIGNKLWILSNLAVAQRKPDIMLSESQMFASWCRSDQCH